jgi:hypothetical protein
MSTNDAAKLLFKSVAVLTLGCLAFFAPIQPSRAETDVFSTFADAGSIGSGSPIITLNVPGGRYAIFAKLGLEQDDTTSLVTVTCTLRAGGDFDRDLIRLAPSGLNRLDLAVIPFQVVHAFRPGTNNNIILSCTFTAAQSSLMSFRFAKITAIRVDGLFCNKPSPAVCP